VAVVVAVTLVVRSRAAALEDVWRRRAQLSFEDPEIGRESLESLATITRGVSDESFVFSSLVDQGRQALRLAQDVPVPPDRDLNEKAQEAFEQLLEQFGDNPLAVGIARTGLATVEENKFVLDGDRVHKERADGHLAAIIDNPAMSGMPFMRMALDRRQSLDAVFTRVVFEYPIPEESQEEAAGDETAAVDNAEPIDELAPVDLPEVVDEGTSEDEAEGVDQPDERTDDSGTTSDDSTVALDEQAESEESSSEPEVPRTVTPDSDRSGAPGSERQDTP